MSSYKDANKLLSSFKNSYWAACKWEEEAKDEDTKTRANSAAVTFLECYLRTKEMPNADVKKVKHGRWINGVCSNCKTDMPIIRICMRRSEPIYEYGGKLNYCPNCGARMDKETEE